MFIWWPWQMPTLERLLETKINLADGVKDSGPAVKRGEVKEQLRSGWESQGPPSRLEALRVD